VAVGDAVYFVSVSIDPDREAEFNRYYHREHIPSVLDACDWIRSAWRYEQFGVDGSLLWYQRRFHTLYALGPGLDLAEIARNGVLPSGDPALASWQEWLGHGLHNVQSAVYQVIYEHPRTPWDGPFGSRPFFMVTADIELEHEAAFASWYHGKYLPANVAEVPTWTAVRRYQSVGDGRRRTFVVYEAWDELGLARSLTAMRGDARLDENLAWHQWEAVIGHEDAATFRPIFRCPG
jgi:hypothetical protein